ncbi:MAG TPA: 4-hydroxy-tetrahydrodipicolinate reductase, partial [Bacillota bacterium]
RRRGGECHGSGEDDRMSNDVTRNVRIVFAGATGKTGGAVARALLDAPDVTIAGAVARRHAGQDLGTVLGRGPLGVVIDGEVAPALDRTGADVLVDFTTPEAGEAHVRAALARGVSVVLGTTGVSFVTLEELGREAEGREAAVLAIANFSLGAMLLARFAREAAELLGAVEIIEKHHATKRDAPSGTALRLAEAVARAAGRDAVPVHSVRLPGLVAHHEIIFGNAGETLTLKHDTISRDSFAPGVRMAVLTASGFRGLVTDFEAVFRAYRHGVAAGQTPASLA